jgi:type IV pilus assembly protein PilA
MIVVAIIGLLAALAIYGVRRYMTNSKTAEGRQALGAISKGARAAFEGEVWTNTAVLDPGATSEASSGKLCPDAAAVPGTVPAGTKYQSKDEEWDDNAGWTCLRFSISGPQYFQYDYSPEGETGFTSTAKADLAKDGDILTLSLGGAVQGKSLTIAPTISESVGADSGDTGGGADTGGDTGASSTGGP